MNRREALAGGLAAAGLRASVSHAQSQTPALGILLFANREPFARHFWEGMRQFGYAEGVNVRAVYRTAEGKAELLPTYAAELAALGVDIIVASETPSAVAAKVATSRIPIVMAPTGDPVGSGLIESLARPGGNVTGLSAAAAELAGKSLELLIELRPTMKHVGALASSTNPFTKPFLQQIHASAAAKSVILEVFDVANGDFEAAFAAMTNNGIDGLIVQQTLPRRPAIELALRRRIPAVSGNRAFADEGGLMSYSASLADRYGNAASYVDLILKGARPGDLPVRQPSRYETVLNAKTARMLGLAMPPGLLARADEVIE